MDRRKRLFRLLTRDAEWSECSGDGGAAEPFDRQTAALCWAAAPLWEPLGVRV